MILTERQERLLQFVKEQHGEQVRKYTGEPYWHHLVSVAEIVSKYEPDGIEIAMCHDLHEDTKCSSINLYSFLLEIGYDGGEANIISDGAIELTDEFTSEKYPKLNREARKIKEAERLSNISRLSQSVKYADLIDNTSSIVKYDKGFAKTYLQEKIRTLDQMRGGNINLLIDCCHILKNSLIELHPLL